MPTTVDDDRGAAWIVREVIASLVAAVFDQLPVNVETTPAGMIRLDGKLVPEGGVEHQAWIAQNTSGIYKRKISRSRRAQLARQRKAIPVYDDDGAIVDGRFPIETRTDLRNAVLAYGRARDSEKAIVRRHIIRRARGLGARDMIPDGWVDKEAGVGHALMTKTQALTDEQIVKAIGRLDGDDDRERVAKLALEQEAERRGLVEKVYDLRTAEGVSRHVRRAWSRQFADDAENWPMVEDVFLDSHPDGPHLLTWDGDAYFQVPYDVDVETGDVSFGQPIPVTVQIAAVEKSGLFERIVEKIAAGLGIADGEVAGSLPVVKSTDEQRFTLAPMYVPEQVDAHGEWTDADELQKALWSLVRKDDGRTIRLQHDRDTVAGELVEAVSWPYETDAEMVVPGVEKGASVRKRVTLPAGTVYAGIVWEPGPWAAIKAGRLRGLSMGGTADRIVADIGEA